MDQMKGELNLYSSLNKSQEDSQDGNRNKMKMTGIRKLTGIDGNP